MLEATSAINLHRTLNTYVRANMKVDNLDYLGEQKGPSPRYKSLKTLVELSIIETLRMMPSFS